MTLSLTYERCVRTRAVASSCRACVDACPTQAMALSGPQASVEVNLEACTECGLCQAVCPTEALGGAVRLEPTALGPRVACGEGVPCVGALSVEALVRLGLAGPRELVAKAGCAHGSTGHRAERVAEANAVLAALGGQALRYVEEGPPAPRRAPPKAPEPVPPRRALFALVVPAAAPKRQKLSRPERLDVAAVRAVEVPAGRRALLAAVPEACTPKPERLASEVVSFASSKRVDEASCTGCMACVSACPTGALTATRLKDTLRFDAHRCVKCKLCHEVCEPRAITLAETFSLREFLDPAPRAPLKLAMRPCGECGRPYKADGEPLCPSCRGQADEARELWGRS